jgi:hypothetical protein
MQSGQQERSILQKPSGQITLLILAVFIVVAIAWYTAW